MNRIVATVGALWLAIASLCLIAPETVCGAILRLPTRPSQPALKIQTNVVFPQKGLEIRRKNLQTGETSPTIYKTVSDAMKDEARDSALEFLTEYLLEVFGESSSSMTPKELINKAKATGFTSSELVANIKKTPVRKSLRIVTNNPAFCNAKPTTSFGTGLSFDEVLSVLTSEQQLLYAYQAGYNGPAREKCSIAFAVRSRQQFRPRGIGYCSDSSNYIRQSNAGSNVDIGTCADECANHASCYHFSIRTTGVKRCELYGSSTATCASRYTGDANAQSYYTYSYVSTPYDLLSRGEIGLRTAGGVVCPALAGSYVDSNTAEAAGFCPVSADSCTMQCSSSVVAQKCPTTRGVITTQATQYGNRGCGQVPIDELCSFKTASAETTFKEVIQTTLGVDVCAFNIPMPITSTSTGRLLDTADDYVPLESAFDTTTLETELARVYATGAASGMRMSTHIGYAFAATILLVLNLF